MNNQFGWPNNPQFMPQAVQPFPMWGQNLQRQEIVRVNGENGEYKAGLRSVAAPIFDADGEVRYAIGIIGMFRQIESEQFEKSIQVVRETAEKISKAI